MTLTENDKLFLAQLQEASSTNRQAEQPQQKVALKTNMALISPELLGMFGVETKHQGGWFFNVYVEFEPMFKVNEAKEWQL